MQTKDAKSIITDAKQNKDAKMMQTNDAKQNKPVKKNQKE